MKKINSSKLGFVAFIMLMGCVIIFASPAVRPADTTEQIAHAYEMRLALMVCPNNPLPNYPFSTSCSNTIGNADIYAMFDELDTLYYRLTGHIYYTYLTSCPPLPNPYYPYDASCNLTIGNADIYACWYVLHGIDSVLLVAPPGGGDVTGNGPLPYIPVWDGSHSLIYSPFFYFDTAAIINGFPAFNVAGFATDTSGSNFTVAWGVGDFMEYANNNIGFDVGSSGSGTGLTAVYGSSFINLGIPQINSFSDIYGLNINADSINIGTTVGTTPNYLAWYKAITIVADDSLVYTGTRFDIDRVHYIWPTHNPGTASVLTNNGTGILSWSASSGSFVAYPPEGYIPFGSLTPTDSLSFNKEGDFFYNAYYNKTGAPSVNPTFYVNLGQKDNVFLKVVDSSNATPAGPSNFIFSTGYLQFWAGVSGSGITMAMPLSQGTTGQVLTMGTPPQTLWANPANPAATQRANLTSPATNITCTTGKSILTLIITGSGIGSVGTITLPASPIDGQEVRVSYSIGSVLLSNFSPVPTLNSATTALSFGYIDLVYNASGTTWYQIQ